MQRIGIGFDAHRFAEERALVLGGVTIPHGRGLLGHSDADVLLHAICDALLGALALGDIGVHFPPSDPAYKGISSVSLLEQTTAMIAEKGYRVGNLDAIIIAEEPKMSPHIETMRLNIAKAVGVGPERIGVKATTTEGMGTVGRKEGIAAQAVVLLITQDAP